MTLIDELKAYCENRGVCDCRNILAIISRHTATPLPASTVDEIVEWIEKTPVVKHTIDYPELLQILARAKAQECAGITAGEMAEFLEWKRAKAAAVEGDKEAEKDYKLAKKVIEAASAHEADKLYECEIIGSCPFAQVDGLVPCFQHKDKCPKPIVLPESCGHTLATCPLRQDKEKI